MRRFGAFCGGLIGWTLGLLLPSYARWPVLSYDPEQARWLWDAPGAASIAIGYYGLLLWGAAGAAVGASLGATARIRGEAAHGLGTAWALTACGLALAYYTFELWP